MVRERERDGGVDMGERENYRDRESKGGERVAKPDTHRKVRGST